MAETPALEEYASMAKGVTWKHGFRSTVVMRGTRFVSELRVEIVLTDFGREVPHYMGKWHLFLPSDVLLGCDVHLLMHA